MDDAVVAVLSECYTEDVGISNLKLSTGFISIVLALVMQFWPETFPANYSLLQGCLVAYVAVTLLTQVFLYIYEKDAIFMSLKTESNPVSVSSAVVPPAWNEYRLSLCLRNSTTTTTATTSHTITISDWFFKDGSFDKDGFVQRVRLLLDQWQTSVAKLR